MDLERRPDLGQLLPGWGEQLRALIFCHICITLGLDLSQPQAFSQRIAQE